VDDVTDVIDVTEVGNVTKEDEMTNVNDESTVSDINNVGVRVDVTKVDVASGDALSRENIVAAKTFLESGVTEINEIVKSDSATRVQKEVKLVTDDVTGKNCVADDLTKKDCVTDDVTRKDCVTDEDDVTKVSSVTNVRRAYARKTQLVGKEGTGSQMQWSTLGDNSLTDDKIDEKNEVSSDELLKMRTNDPANKTVNKIEKIKLVQQVEMLQSNAPHRGTTTAEKVNKSEQVDCDKREEKLNVVKKSDGITTTNVSNEARKTEGI